jgi:hypothetical protein
MPIYNVCVPLVTYGTAKSEVEADTMEEALEIAKSQEAEDFDIEFDFSYSIDVDIDCIEEKPND